MVSGVESRSGNTETEGGGTEVTVVGWWSDAVRQEGGGGESLERKPQMGADKRR